jgi:hypothetical protein
MLQSYNKTFFFLIFIGIIFITFVLPILDYYNVQESNNLKEEFNDIVNRKIDQNICSKQCCKFTQWPVQFNTKDPNIDEEQFKDYIPSNFSCNFGPSGSGCLCIKKSDYDYLANHGQDNIPDNTN